MSGCDAVPRGDTAFRGVGRKVPEPWHKMPCICVTSHNTARRIPVRGTRRVSSIRRDIAARPNCGATRETQKCHALRKRDACEKLVSRVEERGVQREREGLSVSCTRTL